AKELEKELQDAASRMGDLHVTEDDLLREKPRIDDELANMFGRLPPLAAYNHARELVRPSPLGGRKGGVPDHVQALTLREVQDRWKRYYKPSNALLILAGGVDVAAARKVISRHFGALPSGNKAPSAEEPGPAKFGQVKELQVKPLDPNAGPVVCLGYAAPPPDSDRYAAFLVLLSRLQLNSRKL